jgi:hypothetical protein
MNEIGVEVLKEKCIGIVGEDKVIAGEAQLLSYARSGIGAGKKPMLIVKPGSTREIEQLIALAGEHHVNLVPASSGPPHMKGGTLLDQNGIIVDLSAMNDIMLIDRRNKVALVQPGVTYSQLNEEAKKYGLKVLMPLLPKAGKSVLSSYLERDPILIPKYHWDMTDPLLCTEIVFGNGRLYRTGSAGGPGSIKQKIEAKSMFKNPLGPGQTDLMKIVQGAQGTLGIVTWASVKMEVTPAIHRMFFVADEKLERLIEFSYRVLRPKLADEFFILNSQAFASIISRDAGQTASRSKNQKSYVVVYGISGYDVCPEDRIAFQEHDISKIAQQVGVTPSPSYMGITGSKFSRLIGAPSSEPYYKNRVKGGFSDIHFLSTMDRAGQFVAAMPGIAARHGYPETEIGIYIQPILFGRACHIEFSFFYDPEDATASVQMERLFTDASAQMAKDGAFYSRPYGRWADLAYGKCPDTVLALHKIQEIFDPGHILNRGKLVFKEAV